MNDLTIEDLLLKPDPNTLGEMLRAVFFYKQDENNFGCYYTFDILPTAKPLTEIERQAFWAEAEKHQSRLFDLDVLEYAKEVGALGEGAKLQIGSLTVDMCYYWDGDGCLAFSIYREDTLLAFIQNTDCKKNYKWENLG